MSALKMSAVGRTPGWISLAAAAFEVVALTFAEKAMGERASSAPESLIRYPDVPPAAQATTDAAVIDETHPEVAVAAALSGPNLPPFLSEDADEATRYYRSADDATAWLAAAFYRDGRVRVVDGDARMYAGTVQNGRAPLETIDSHERCELFVEMSGDGNVRLSLLGGAHDGRVVRCEAV